MVLMTILMTGCGATNPIEPIPCPARPVLDNVWIDDDQTRETVFSNYLKLSTYAQKLEVRAECEQ